MDARLLRLLRCRPAGSSDFGPALREPIGPLHWAGTETATVWNGCMDGAVRSGERGGRRRWIEPPVAGYTGPGMGKT